MSEEHKLKVATSAASGLVLTCDKCEYVSTVRGDAFVDYLVSVQRSHNSEVHALYLNGAVMKCSALNCDYNRVVPADQLTVAAMYKMERDHVEERKRA